MKRMTTFKQDRQQVPNYRKFTFHPIFNHKFSKIFRRFDIELSFNNRSNVTNSFSKKIEKEDHVLQKFGIYELKCEGCVKVYIGQTKRTIKLRAEEHVRNVKNREVQRSAVAEHFWDTGHNINFEPYLY